MHVINVIGFICFCTFNIDAAFVAVVSGDKSHEHKFYTTLCFVASEIMIKGFSQFMYCIMYVPGSHQVLAKYKNTIFISFDRRVKSYCVNRFTRYSANDHKNTSVCFLQQISLFFPFHLCRAKASDGRSWKREATREHCQLWQGPGQGTHPTPATGLMCDIGQTTYSLWTLPFTVCHSKLV